MGIPLCGGQTRVPEEVLHGPDVGSALEEMRGEGMPERVRTHLSTPQDDLHVPVHQCPGIARAHALSTTIEEDRGLVRYPPTGRGSPPPIRRGQERRSPRP